MRRTLTNPTTVTTLAASAVMFLPLTSSAQGSRPEVPFTVGEELTYRATFGKIPAGTARMRVDCIEVVRGRPAYRGEDNREVFGRLLGLDDGTLDRLESDGVLTSRVPTG